MEPIEAAFFSGENSEGWWSKITWRCPRCGRRNFKSLKGPGRMADCLPLKVLCKFGHESEVVPYRWTGSLTK